MHQRACEVPAGAYAPGRLHQDGEVTGEGTDKISHVVVAPAPKEDGCGAENLLSAKRQLVTEDRNAPATCTRGTTVTSLDQ